MRFSVREDIVAGFKSFLMRGNLIDLAVAFILGASFNTVVTAFTKIIMDLLGLAGGQPNFDAVAIGPIAVGPFITAVVSFVMLAAILYFALVHPVEMAKRHMDAKKADEPPAPTPEELLTEIRDLLAKKH